MEIILKGVDPRLFNLIASLLAEFLQLAGAFTLSAFLHLMVSVYLRKGKQVPVKALGPLPGGLIDAWHYAWSMKWAWPASVAFFLFISDYSTAIAFAGLGFVQVDQEGAHAPILNLAKRNALFPYEAVGDPLLPFTASKLELIMESSSYMDSSTIKDEDILKLSREEVMVSSFLGAADSIAQGSSIFLDQSNELLNDPTLLVRGKSSSIFSDIEDKTILHGEKSPLASINLEIPLDCAEDTMASMEDMDQEENWMTEIKEQRGPDDWTLASLIPNCTFNVLRGSGIFDDGGSGKAEVTAYARIGPRTQTRLLLQGQHIDDQTTFVFPYEGLHLARETDDFRKGRWVFGFGGVQIGNTTLPFEATVVASGKSLADPPQALDPEDQNAVRTREYLLVSKVNDESQNCPKDPSGYHSSLCMVTVKVTCETFGSEVGVGGLLNGYGKSSDSFELPTQLEHMCIFNGDIEIIWGTGYDVDQQLLAAVAGIHSRNTGWALSARQRRTLSIHSIPASLFVLSTLNRKASIESVESTTIDGVFITFMLVPACLCVATGCMYLFGMGYLLPLPDNGEAMIDLGTTSSETEQQHHHHHHQQDVHQRWLCWNGQSLSLNFESTSRQSNCGEHHEPGQEKTQINLERPCSDVEHEEIIDVDESDKVLKETKINIHSQSSLMSHASLQLFGIHFDETTAGKETADDKSISPGETGVDPDRIKQQGVEDLENRCRDQDPAIVTLDGSSSNKNKTQASHADSLCSLLFKGNGIHVVCCMAFCIAVTLLASTFIKNRTLDTGNAHIHYEQIQIQTEEGILQDNNPACFLNNDELRKAVADYLSGPGLRQTSAIIEKYGQFEDWCIDLVDDFSFVFSGLPKEHQLNASNWDVSHVKKFSFCFFNAENIFDVSNWDVSSGEYFHGMFYGASTFSSDLSNWNVSSGIGFNSMFQDAASFDSDLSDWDVSSGTDFVSMFRDATSFNSNLSQWDVSGVTDFGYIFAGAESFDSDISLWDVSSATSFAHMFDGASVMNSDLSVWDVSSGTDFSWMFNDATSFNSNVSSWKVGSGRTFHHMFSGATGFNSDLSQWNVSSGTDFSYIFQGATNFQSDISLWDVSSVTDFSHSFDSSTSFNANLSQWDVSSGSRFAFMFDGATIFNSDVSAWDVSSGVDFSWMFRGATNFAPKVLDWDVSEGVDFRGMFSGSTSFNGDLSRWDVSSGISFAYMFDGARRFNSELPDWDVSSGTDFGWMFHGAVIFNSDISMWDVSSGRGFGYMFDGATKFNVDLSKWDVSSGTYFSHMFQDATSFNADLSQWDVSSGSYFVGMFSAATSFSSDLAQWDVSSGIDFGLMFSGAELFNSDLSLWDVSSGQFFGYMFDRAKEFNSDLSQWDVSSGTDFSGMFHDTENFNSDLSQWDVSSGTEFRHMFERASSFISDISAWDVSSGRDFAYMFRSTGHFFGDEQGFNSDLSNWDVSSGVDFGFMFNFARSFNSDLSLWDVSSGRNFASMFFDAVSFNSDLSGWDVSSGTDFSYMFDGARHFDSNISQWKVSSGTNFARMFENAKDFNSDLSMWDVSSSTSFAYMFYSASKFNSDLSHWNVSLGKDFSWMYAFASRFNSDLSQWDVSSGFDFSYMFRGSYPGTIFNSDISKWDVSSGTNFEGMFYGAQGFNSDLSSWNVSSGTIFTSMFQLARVFNADLSKWDVSSGTDFSRMFQGSWSGSGFISDLSEWDVSSGTNFHSMFEWARSFNSDLSQWDVSAGTSFERMFYNAFAFNSDLSQWNVSSGVDFNLIFSGATKFNANLCPWYSLMDSNPLFDARNTNRMFFRTSCPHQPLTFSPETMCHRCLPTDAPTPAPTQAVLFIGNAELFPEQHWLNFDSTPLGPIHKDYFHTSGIEEIGVIGSFSHKGDTLAGIKSNALCSAGEQLSIVPPEGSMDSPAEDDTGFSFKLCQGVRQFGFAIVDQNHLVLTVTLLNNGQYVGTFNHQINGFPKSPTNFFQPRQTVDEILITSKRSGGWCLDDVVFAGYEGGNMQCESPSSQPSTSPAPSV